MIRPATPVTPGASHAAILAFCDLVDVDEDTLHDVLDGHEPVLTSPEPTYLFLTALEKARGCLLQAEQRLNRAKVGNADREDLDLARRQRDLQDLRVKHALVVEAIGTLRHGRSVEFDWGDARRYAVVAEDGALLFHVPASTKPGALRLALDVYDSAYAAGM